MLEHMAAPNGIKRAINRRFEKIPYPIRRWQQITRNDLLVKQLEKPGVLSDPHADVQYGFKRVVSD